MEELCGIGPRLARSLGHLGIRTCGQLGRMPVDILARRYGIIGERLRTMARGLDYSPVVPIGEEPEVKSVGHSMTLQQDLGDPSAILRQLLLLSQMVGRRARSYALAGRTVALTIRYKDFQTFTTRKTITQAINGTHEIRQVAGDILSGIRLLQPVRLLGVSLSNLSSQAGQLPLLGWSKKEAQVCRVMVRINDRFGENTIIWGELLPAPVKVSRIISPSWRPSGVRRVDVR